MAQGNGGIIGPVNTVSCSASTKVTSITSSGNFTKDNKAVPNIFESSQTVKRTGGTCSSFL